MNPGQALHEDTRARGRLSGLPLGIESTATWGFCALLLTAFVVAPYLPMVDFPQHAAQISAWLRLSDPASLASRYFTVNLSTPYLTAYVAAKLLATVLGVVSALKFVVWASAALYVFAFSLLVRRLGHPRFLAVLGLPLGLGYPFFFGMVSFTAAMPFVLLTIAAALAHREAPSYRTWGLFALALSATLVAHGFAAGVAIMLVAPLLLRGGGNFAARVSPLMAPLVLWAVWLRPAHSVRTIGGTLWAPRILELLQAPALWFAASSYDHVAVVFGYGALFLVLFALGRPSRTPERWMPLALLAVAYCTFPLMLSGFGPLHPRFAAFMVPALLLGFEPRTALRHPALPAIAVALVGAWLGLFAVRLSAFTEETRPLRDFIARMPDDQSVRPIVFERNSEAFPGLPALLHLSAYYMTEKGGLQGYSFAMYPTSVIRYVPEYTPGMQGGAEWHPETFSPVEVGYYDCFLVHSKMDISYALFGDRLSELTLDFHEGGWWAYRPRAAHLTAAFGSRLGMEP